MAHKRRQMGEEKAGKPPRLDSFLLQTGCCSPRGGRRDEEEWARPGAAKPAETSGEKVARLARSGRVSALIRNILEAGPSVRIDMGKANKKEAREAAEWVAWAYGIGGERDKLDALVHAYGLGKKKIIDRVVETGKGGEVEQSYGLLARIPGNTEARCSMLLAMKIKGETPKLAAREAKNACDEFLLAVMDAPDEYKADMRACAGRAASFAAGIWEEMGETARAGRMHAEAGEILFRAADENMPDWSVFSKAQLIAWAKEEFSLALELKWDVKVSSRIEMCDRALEKISWDDALMRMGGL